MNKGILTMGIIACLGLGAMAQEPAEETPQG